MKKIIAGIMTVIMVGSLTACGTSNDGASSSGNEGGSDSEKVYELRLATNLPDDHVATKGYYEFAQNVEADTDGAVKVTVYPGEQLGKESDVTSSISMGAKTCDIVMAGASELAKYDPTFTLFDAPYIFDNGEAMVEFANSDDVKVLYDELAEISNLRVLGSFYYGSREITTKGYNATVPSDLSGCKLRVPDAEMAMQYGAALGATPTVMSLGEVYMGIQQGVVSGQENPLPTIDSNAFYEVCDYLLMTDHVIASVSYVVDETIWQSMPTELQEIVQENVYESCDSISAGIKEQEAGLQKTLAEKGMTIVEVDKEAFKENCAPIYEKYADTWGEWLDTARSFN